MYVVMKKGAGIADWKRSLETGGPHECCQGQLKPRRQVTMGFTYFAGYYYHRTPQKKDNLSGAEAESLGPRALFKTGKHPGAHALCGSGMRR